MQIPLIPPPASKLRLRRLGIYAYQEPVLHLHRDCPVCHSEGSEGQSRVELKLNGRTIVATLNVVNGDFLPSDDGWRVRSGVDLLKAWPGDAVSPDHLAPTGRRLFRQN